MHECQKCGHPWARFYLTGWWCDDHTPSARAGRPEHVPDPDTTLEALRARAGRTWGFNPNDSALIDQRAIASGKRRSAPADYRLAQEAEAERRAARG